MLTQQEVDNTIQTLIRLARRFEEARDKNVFESPEYWKAHDQAVELHQQAERLMPGGSFWTRS